MKTTRRRGFSMTEMLFAMAIGTVIAGGVLALLMSQAQLSATQNRNMLNTENVRDVIGLITDEIMLAATLDGTEPMIAANNNDVSFFADINGDGTTDTIAYYLDGDDLKRSFITTAGSGSSADDVLLSGVTNLEFTYFAPDDAAPVTIDDITSIEVRLEIDTSAGTAWTSGKLKAQAMVGRATIRNKIL